MAAQAFLWNLGKLVRRVQVFYVGPSIDVDVHQHHLTQICVGLTEPARIHRADGSVVEHEAVVVHADEPHRVTTRSGSPIGVVYLSSEACVLKPTMTAGEGGLRPVKLDPALLDALRRAYERNVELAEARELSEELVRACVGPIEERIDDARIRAVVEHLRNDPTLKHSAGSLTAISKLSARRLSELFREEVGLPVRRYIVWLRVRVAIARFLSGTSLTEAAHSAGFTDLAHLSHAFRDMYGVAPSGTVDPSWRPRFVMADDP